MVEKIDRLILKLAPLPNLHKVWQAQQSLGKFLGFPYLRQLHFLLNFVIQNFKYLVLKSTLQKFLYIFAFLSAWGFFSIVQAQSLPSFISDDETETLLQNIIRPIFNTAGVPFNANKIYIINDNSLNAFVSNGNYMFINTGTLMNAGNVNQLNGILAHETGHIAGGHIVRQKLQINKMKTLAVASLIAAGAAAAASGRGDAAMAVMLGSQSSLINSMTSYQLQEERSADESAVKYLRQLGQSPQGLKDFMKKIQNSNRLNGYEEFPYFRTHPMSSERLQFFDSAAFSSNGKTSSQYDDEFDKVKAKLTAFLLPTARGWQIYPLADKSEASQYAHAILYYRQNKLSQALKTLNTLISSHPNNPYYPELKGQFLFESGKINEALQSYQTALKLRPNSPEIMLGWAQAALEAPHNKQQLQNIINKLNQIQIKKPNLTAWILLARAYDENGQPADALYASAQYSAALENFELARRQIEQAQKISSSPHLNLKLRDLQNLIQTMEK